MNKQQMIDRISELEKRVRDLEARPVYIQIPAQPQWVYRTSPTTIGGIQECGDSIGVTYTVAS